MTPSLALVLADLAQRLAGETDQVPALLLGLAAESVDGAADLLFQENRDFRALLARGETWLDGADRALAQERDQSVRISDLKSANDRLRAALIRLHIHAETQQDIGLEQAIWRELARSTERRKTVTSPA